MAIPLKEIVPEKLHLSDWERQHFDSDIPPWACRSLSTSRKEGELFAEKLTLFRLFTMPALSAAETKPEEILERFYSLIDDVPCSSYVYGMISRLKLIVEAETGLKIPGELRHSSELERHPWVYQYGRYLASEGRQKRSIEEETRIAWQFLCWLPTLAKFDGALPNEISLYALENDDVRIYINVLRRKIHSGGISQNFAAQSSTITLSFLRFCINQFGLHDIVQNLHGLPYKDTIDLWIPTQRQVEAFFDSILRYSENPLQNFVLFGLMYLLGLRPGEALGLMWPKVDLDNGIIEFTAKGGHQTSMALNSVLRRLLSDLNVFRGNEKYVFNNGRGKCLDVQDMWKRFRVFATIANWPDASWPKTFRHAFCTHTLLETHDYLLVNRLARHTKLETTQRYVHFIKQVFAQASGSIQENFQIKEW